MMKSEPQQFRPFITVKDIAKILSSDKRLKDKRLTLPACLGIIARDIPFLNKRNKADDEDYIHVTLEYWLSINGDEATILKLISHLKKDKYSNIITKLQVYKGYSVVTDSELQVDEEDENMEAVDADLADLAELMTGTTIDETDSEGFGTGNSFLITGMKDLGNQAKDNAIVQKVFDQHNLDLEVVGSRRLPSKDKLKRPLKVLMKPRKSKSPLKSLMNRALNKLSRGQLFSGTTLKITEYDPSKAVELANKKGNFFTMSKAGAFISGALHFAADITDRMCGNKK